MKAKILICCHKPCDYPQEEPFLPVHGGKAMATVDLNMQGDDTGDNISYKNSYYNELTVMYWAWKNLKDVDVIGLCHYRRYFDFHHRGAVICVPTAQFHQTDVSIPASVLNSLKEGEIVLCTASVLPFSVGTYYCTLHQSDDFRTLEKFINETQYQEVDRQVSSVGCQKQAGTEECDSTEAATILDIPNNRKKKTKKRNTMNYALLEGG